MSRENTAGLSVNTQYGPRNVPDGTMGVIKTAGGENQLTVEFTGANINAGEVQTFTIPANSRVISSFVEIEEAFTMGGTTPTINVGTATTAATNGVSLDETGAETIGTYTDGDSNVTINGTWATTTAFNSEVSVALELGGTTPTVTDGGKARFVVVYVKV